MAVACVYRDGSIADLNFTCQGMGTTAAGLGLWYVALLIYVHREACVVGSGSIARHD